MFLVIVGNDARKVIADGYPFKYVVTSDLQPGVSSAKVMDTKT